MGTWFRNTDGIKVLVKQVNGDELLITYYVNTYGVPKQTSRRPKIVNFVKKHHR